MRIFTVFRPSKTYKEEHVERLAEQVKTYSGIDLDCITDSPWPHWWSKIALYKEVGPILYMDLDTTVIGDLEPLLREVEKHDFIALASYWKLASRRTPLPTERLATGITGWRGDAVRHLYDIFKEHPDKYMQSLRGDDDFVTENYQGAVARWQVLNFDWIQSYKYHIRNRESIAENCRVVCYHGVPKPWDRHPLTGGIFDDDVRKKIWKTL